MMVARDRSNIERTAEATGEYAIETSELVKVYKEGQIKALNGLDLKIHRGEIYALIGANGSGKSTAINLITGSIFPTSGSIRVLGYEVPQKRHLVATQIGVAPQEYAIYNDLSVEQNIWFFARLQGMNRTQLEKRMAELLPIFRLDERRKTSANELSGGMKRRLSVVCALIHRPKILFLDEATVGIDPVLREFFWDYFRALCGEGLTIVVTSHVMDEAERADRVGLMREGKLIEEGTPGEVKCRHSVESIEEVFIKLSKGVVIDG
ncbi:MAG TPA: ABC transporter ATP-binding protein [Candidatus Acidoferrales bacterium]|nr:ABC transporter ATP-binding protein [Candidatus Acidoferrales bacterium]